MEIFHIKNTADAIVARRRGREAAQTIGLGLVDQTLVAYMISELALRLIQFPEKGHMVIRIIQRCKGESRLGIEVRAFDHYRGSRESVYGWSNKVMKELEISSDASRSTVLTFRKWLPIPARPSTAIYAAGEE